MNYHCPKILSRLKFLKFNTHSLIKILKGKTLTDFSPSFSGSQELHVAQTPPAAFNKFNSLDRRALARRHQTSSNLKLVPPTSTSSGAESLPLPSSNGRPPFGHVAASVSIFNNNANDKLNKEPERRHSSYDPASRSSSRYRPLQGSDQRGPPPTNIVKNGDRLSAMNINGLPEPSYRSANGIYSSQESLRVTTPRGTSGGRGGAGTPQFQNLSGTIRTTNTTSTRGSLNNLNGNNVTSSSNYASAGPFHRSISGTNLHHLDHHQGAPQQSHHHHHHGGHHARMLDSSNSTGSSSSSGSTSTTTGTETILYNNSSSYITFLYC